MQDLIRLGKSPLYKPCNRSSRIVWEMQVLRDEQVKFWKKNCVILIEQQQFKPCTYEVWLLKWDYLRKRFYFIDYSTINPHPTSFFPWTKAILEVIHCKSIWKLSQFFLHLLCWLKSGSFWGRLNIQQRKLSQGAKLDENSACLKTGVPLVDK